MNDTLPPHDDFAERAVLGSMLRSKAAIGEALLVLRKDELYSDAHQKIFDAIAALYDQGKVVEAGILADVLHQRKQIEDVGGYPYIGELLNFVPVASNVKHYARIVRDKAKARHLIQAGRRIAQDAQDEVAPIEELIEAAEREIFSVAESSLAGETLDTRAVVRAGWDYLDGVRERGGVTTGFLELDELTAGLHRSELVVVAARPSRGKTALALCIARHLYLEGTPVLFISLEQTIPELSLRLLCVESGIDSHRARRGQLGQEEIRLMMEAGERLCQGTLFVDDVPGQSMVRISANARRLKTKHGIGLVVVDYLQLVEPDNRRENRQEQVAAIARRLKHLARELEIPVLAAAQLNRTPENRQDRRPKLSDLRESGAIEAHADQVLLLHWPEAEQEQEPGKKAERSDQELEPVDVLVAKHRNGRTGDVRLNFRKKCMRFENLVLDDGANGQVAPGHQLFA